MPSLPLESQQQAAREAIDILAEISILLVPLSALTPSKFKPWQPRR